MSRIFKIIQFIFIIAYCSNFSGQTSTRIYKRISRDFFEIDEKTLYNELQKEIKIITLPTSNELSQKFTLHASDVLPIELSNKYGINIFDGFAIENPKLKITITIFEGKSFVSIYDNGETIVLHPKPKGHQMLKKNNSQKITCKNSQDHLLTEDNAKQKLAKIQSLQQTVSLRTYRMAPSCSAEYTSYHGGTRAGALAAIATTLARVNQIYNSDLSLNFVIASDIDELLFTSVASQPWTDNDPDQILRDMDTEFDDKISRTKYDFRHVFTTGGGGLADIKSICSNASGGGVTGSESPEGEFFDVDYVTHEIGHQFGALHTFNGVDDNCSSSNRDSEAAYEPGSGSTIMAYTGICGDDNIQNNSDPYFHNSTIREIRAYVTSGGARNCGTNGSTANNIPTITSSTVSGLTIPRSTPFLLTGAGSDLDNDPLTYNWEQYNLGAAIALNSYSFDGPIFRSFKPTSNPTRYFPTLSSIVHKSSSLGEFLPTNTRTLNFSFNVRDSKGGVVFKNIDVKVDANSGPFVVNSPAINSVFKANQNVSITWNVANTNVSPVNCANVEIYLSIDGGLTFPIKILESTPNDGNADIIFPSNGVSTNARLMIKGKDHHFFNLNPGNFIIEENLSSTNDLINDAAIVLFPNPTESILKIDNYIGNVSILSLNGLTILNFRSTESIDVSSLQKGLYYIKFEDSRVFKFEKI